MVIVLFIVSIGFSAVRLIQLKSEKDKLEKLNEELTQMKDVYKRQDMGKQIYQVQR